MTSIFWDFIFENYILLIMVMGMFIVTTFDTFLERSIIHRLRWTLLMLLVLVIADKVKYLAESVWRIRWLLILCSAIGYTLRILIVMMLIFIIRKKMSGLAAIPAVINCVVAFSALFSEIAYGFDEKLVFFRGPLGFTPYIVSIFYIFILFYLSISSFSKRIDAEGIVVLFIAVTACLAALMALYDHDELTNPTYAAEILLYYLYVYQQHTKHYVQVKGELVEQLNEKSERAFAASQAKSSFLANMSHEIRTPINAVLGMNEMILRESEDSNIVGYAENVRIAGNTLLGLINDILDFSKIEAGKIEIIPVDYDLSSVINDLVVMAKTRADKKGLALELDFDKEIPKILNGDEVRIKQVITNILTNAVKYTEKGSIRFHIGFERIQEEPDQVLLRVSVKDTGIGIKPEDMPKLFSKFERIEENRNRNVEGTGLGMSITQSLLSMMGSELEVTSTYGEGSEFSFALKQRVVKWDALGDYESSYQMLVHNREKYREKFIAPEACVLVVDDNPMNLIVFKGLLKQTKIKVETADNGDEGLTMASGKKYDVIFLDHMMPGKDGIETLHEMKAQKDNPNHETPTVCLTANAISGAREQYVAAGFDDYLTKPVDSSKLEEMMMEYLPGDKIIRKQEKEQDSGTDAEAGTEPEGMKDPVSQADTDRLEILQNCEEIDVSAGIHNSGSVEGYLSMIKIFYDSLEEKLSEIESFYESGDFKGYTIKVHALKSSARIIGAEEIGEDAQKLEAAGKRDDLDYIRAHHGVFLSRCRKLNEKLSESCMEAEESIGKAQISEEMLKSAYEEIRQAAEDMNIDRLEEILKQLEGYAVPQSEEERYKEIKAAVSGFDYDAVLEVLPQEG